MKAFLNVKSPKAQDYDKVSDLALETTLSRDYNENQLRAIFNSWCNTMNKGFLKSKEFTQPMPISQMK